MHSNAALKESTTQRLRVGFHGNRGPWALALTAGNAADFHSSIFLLDIRCLMAILNIWESKTYRVCVYVCAGCVDQYIHKTKTT